MIKKGNLFPLHRVWMKLLLLMIRQVNFTNCIARQQEPFLRVYITTVSGEAH